MLRFPLKGSLMVEMYRLPQEIKLTGEFPGPSSRALAHRRSQAVPASVASGLPVYAADADGGSLLMLMVTRWLIWEQVSQSQLLVHQLPRWYKQFKNRSHTSPTPVLWLLLMRGISQFLKN